MLGTRNLVTLSRIYRKQAIKENKGGKGREWCSNFLGTIQFGVSEKISYMIELLFQENNASLSCLSLKFWIKLIQGSQI